MIVTLTDVNGVETKPVVLSGYSNNRKKKYCIVILNYENRIERLYYNNKAIAETIYLLAGLMYGFNAVCLKINE